MRRRDPPLTGSCCTEAEAQIFVFGSETSADKTWEFTMNKGKNLKPSVCCYRIFNVREMLT